MKLTCCVAALTAALVMFGSIGHAETPEEWIKLGARIHGAFGAFIPVGIRIGLDARERLKAAPRELAVIYFSGDKSPCPCVADGIMIATHASPGQGTLHIAADKAPEGSMAVAIIRNRKTAGSEIHTITDDWLPRILGWNKTYDPAGRYEAAMKADALFQVEPDHPN
jgi:formylmethanofuran dehydrogenase subunit E